MPDFPTRQQLSEMSSIELRRTKAVINIADDKWQIRDLNRAIELAKARESEYREQRTEEREKQLYELAKQANNLVKETNAVMRQQRNIAIGALTVAALSIIASILLTLLGT